MPQWYYTPSVFQQPDLDILSVMTRAIHHKKAAVVDYQDIKRGTVTREIVPFALADNGLRWHVRAFDRQEKEFKDFVLARILSADFVAGSILESESKDSDIQWNRIVELELVPHPTNALNKKAIENEYGLKNGVLNIRVRAALAGHALRRWNVDCAEEASVKGHEHHLWLRNRQTLYGVENLSIAPGFDEKTSR